MITFGKSVMKMAMNFGHCETIYTRNNNNILGCASFFLDRLLVCPEKEGRGFNERK